MMAILFELLIAAAIFGGLFGAFSMGSRLGRVDDDEQSHLGVIQGATLGLIGLLIGFCFSGALNRFVDRQDLMVQESNAIGTAFLRADILPESQRNQLRLSLKEYSKERIKLFDASSDEAASAINQKLATLQDSIWKTAIAGVADRPHAVNVVLPSLNEVFDLLSSRNAAVRRHMPILVLVLVLATVFLGAVLLGYGQGGRRRPIRMAAMGVVVLIGGIIWATIDLDFPRRGLIQINDESFRELIISMER